MKKKYILILFILIFSIIQENQVFAIGSDKLEAKFIDPYYVRVGDSFKHEDAFISAKEKKTGRNVPISEFRFQNGPFDTSKPGSYYTAGYRWLGDFNSPFLVSVIVPHDLSLKTKDGIQYTGQHRDPSINFVSATDEHAKSVPWDDPRMSITYENGTDFSKPGIYGVKFTLKGIMDTVESESTVTIRENKGSIKTKDSMLYVGQEWNAKDNFVSATDEEGQPIQLEDKRISYNKPDLSKPGVHKVKYIFHSKGKEFESESSIAVKEDLSSIKTKDSTLYVGQKWNPEDNFVSAADEEGKNIPWGDRRINQNNTSVDTSKPGVYQNKYTLNGKAKDIDSSFTVTVKEDKTKVELQDAVLYRNQKWDIASVIKTVADKDGNPITPEQIDNVWIDGEKTKELDTSKLNTHSVQFAVLNAYNEWINSNKVMVTIKEDLTSIKTKDSMLYVGQKWEPKGNFVSATDEEGHPVPWEDPRIIKNELNIDTSKPAEYKIEYTFQGKVKNVNSSFTVTVKDEPFIINQVPYFDFEDYILEPSNKSVSNKKDNPTIELETPPINGKDWQLQVELYPFLDKVNDKNILKGVSLFIPKGKLESDLEIDEPIQHESHLEANGEASIFMRGTKIKGKGRWKNKLKTQEIILSIPSENKKGNYESTLHWTLLDVPS